MYDNIIHKHYYWYFAFSSNLFHSLLHVSDFLYTSIVMDAEITDKRKYFAGDQDWDDREEKISSEKFREQVEKGMLQQKEYDRSKRRSVQKSWIIEYKGAEFDEKLGELLCKIFFR